MDAERERALCRIICTAYYEYNSCKIVGDGTRKDKLQENFFEQCLSGIPNCACNCLTLEQYSAMRKEFGKITEFQIDQELCEYFLDGNAYERGESTGSVEDTYIRETCKKQFTVCTEKSQEIVIGVKRHLCEGSLVSETTYARLCSEHRAVGLVCLIYWYTDMLRTVRNNAQDSLDAGLYCRCFWSMFQRSATPTAVQQCISSIRTKGVYANLFAYTHHIETAITTDATTIADANTYVVVVTNIWKSLQRVIMYLMERCTDVTYKYAYVWFDALYDLLQ